MDVETTEIEQLVPMAESTAGYKARLFSKMLAWAKKPGSAWALFFISLIHSAFFPIPALVAFVTLSLASVERTFWFALVSTAGSVVGGTIAYWMGYAAWGTLKGVFIPYFFSEHLLIRAESIYDGNLFLALLAASVLPISYQVGAIAAGVLKVSFTSFLIASCFARALRFFGMAVLVHFFGERAKKYIQGHLGWFWWAVIFVVIGVLGVAIAFRMLQ
ncbi:MAG: rane protein DedA [Verrucomicrobiales bacterium]|nr:rane protein DedA [Verrucomicrobiales bacterium]